MLKIRELIKKVRACRTAQEERSVINKEAAEIRNASKDLNNPHKARDLAKAIYMQMMGYQTSFMQLSCINLLASKNYTEKRMAYSALSLVMDETSKILLLATGTIKKDLASEEKTSIALALNAIGDVCTPDMCRELSPEVGNIIKTNNDPNIKKKAACAASHIIKKCPEVIDTFKDKIEYLVEDRTHSVCMTGIILMIEMIKINPKLEKHFRNYHKTFIKYEKSLLNVSYSPEFDVNGITDPFLQSRLIEVMKYTAKGSKENTEELADLFVTVQSLTEASKQTGYAIQYEIVKAINQLEANKGLKSLSSNILGKFLSGKDLNLKYIALNTLKDVVRFDLGEVQKHKDLILSFLNETDISLQKRALDLIYLIVNSNNLKQITKECLKFLPKCDDELKLEVTSKLTDCIDQYAQNFKWEIDTLIKMVVLSSNKIYDDTLSKIINIIIKVKELKVYSAHKLFITLKNNDKNEALVKLALYVIGEFCDSLTSNSVYGAANENISVSIEEVISLLEDCGEKNKTSYSVLEYLLNTLVKISIKFPQKSEAIKEIIGSYNRNFFFEVQQRAAEYLVLQNCENPQLKQKIIEDIPTPKEDNINDKSLIDQNETQDEDEEKECVIKLKTTPVKGDNSNNNFSIPSNIGDIIDNMNLVSSNTNTNDNNKQDNNDQNQNNQSGSLNLLDLNNIFGNSNTNTTPTNPTAPNPQQNSNPFELFSLGTNPPNPQQSTQSNNFFDTISAQQPITVPQQNQAQMKECFRNEYITLYYQITKTSDTTYDGSVYATNNSGEIIENIKLNFMVLKFVTLKVLSTSGNSLQANQSLGLRKDFTMTSSDASKKVVMKIKLVYQVRGNESSSMITIDDF